MEGLKYVRSLGWGEVFSAWEREEAHLPRWIEHYKKRGFSTWKEWRSNSVHDLNPEELEWKLFNIENNALVGQFYGGPFRAWQKKYYDGRDVLEFEELARIPELQNDANINEIIRDFPIKSTLVALKKGEHIIVIEGMHRCSALAVAMERGVVINVTLSIVIADFHDPLPTLGKVDSPT